MLLGLQKKLAYLIGQFHSGKVDVEAVMAVALDREFLSSLCISRAKKDAFLVVFEEVLKETLFLEWRKRFCDCKERDELMLLRPEDMTLAPDQVTAESITGPVDLLKLLRHFRIRLHGAKLPQQFVSEWDSVLRLIEHFCTGASYRVSGVGKEWVYAQTYFSNLVSALLEL